LKTLTEPARAVPVYGEYDIAVLGGGPAGIAAAFATSRAGRKTLLIERPSPCRLRVQAVVIFSRRAPPQVTAAYPQIASVPGGSC